MNARVAAQRVDHQTGVVGESGAARCPCGGLGLDARILGEGLAGFLRLRKVELARRLRFDAERRQQFAHFLELARIVGRDYDRAGELPAHVTANF